MTKKKMTNAERRQQKYSNRCFVLGAMNRDQLWERTPESAEVTKHTTAEELRSIILEHEFPHQGEQHDY